MALDEKQLERIGEQFGEYLAQRMREGIARVGVITDVDDTHATFSERSDDAPIRVPLMCLNAGSAVLKVKPALSSTAIVLYANGQPSLPIFVGFTEVDEINVVVGESSVKITNDAITFNGGKNDGLVLSQKAVDRLNAIERDINTLKTAFATWVVAPTDGGAALFSLTKSWAAQRLTETVLSDIENDKIMQ